MTMSVKKNFFWSSLLNIAGYIFPLLTFPYVTRVLGVEGIGATQYADSIIQYFAIFSMLGISTIGIREIAQFKGDRHRMSEVFYSLLALNLITSVISVSVLLIMVAVVPTFASHKELIFIGAARILCGALVVEWFFRGMENFRYITIRSLIIRLLYVASVFLFIKDRDDYITYFLLTTLATIANAVVNIFYSIRFVSFSSCRINFVPYIKPLLTLGAYQILTAMYISFNVMFLGNKCGDIEVGYYTTATRLYGIVMSFFSVFTGVMMPRMSSLVAEGKNEEFTHMTSKSIDLLLAFTLPIIVLTEVYCPQIINIIAGDGYEGAITPMRIVMPLMLIIGYEQIIIIQNLSPLRKDKAILVNSCIGASVALVLSFTIVSHLGCIGSAIVWSCSELSVLLSAQYFVTIYTGQKMPINRILLSLLAYIPALITCMIINGLVGNVILSMTMSTLFMLIYFIIIEYKVLDNKLIVNLVMIIKERYGRKDINSNCNV